jgi:molybdopterin biosynthesis enzyme
MTLMSSASALLPLDEALAQLLAGLDPVAAETLPVVEAVGWVSAGTLRAPAAVPARPLALRRGIAVASASLIGASPHAPVLLPAPPAPVLPGDELPAGADAVLPPDAAAASGPFHEIGQPAYPGEGAALTGSDLANDAVIVEAGATITAEVVLALTLAGIATAPVRRPRVAVTGEAGGAEAAWLRARLAEAGCIVMEAPPADLVLHLARDPTAIAPGAGLALQPGGEAVLAPGAASRTLVLPPRFDALAAALFALVMPCLAAAAGRGLRTVSRPLTRKVVSQVGLADIALLRHTADGWEPLGVGRITLAALLAADAVAVLGPASEGAAAGSALAAMPLTEPFEPR